MNFHTLFNDIGLTQTYTRSQIREIMETFHPMQLRDVAEAAHRLGDIAEGMAQYKEDVVKGFIS